jgi:hypothetical protein
MRIQCKLGLICLLAITPAFGETRRWNVLEAGAVGNGKDDCTTVFQELLNDAGKMGGGVVEVPAGQYRISTGLSIPANVTLQGIYRVPPTSGPRPVAKLTGSVLFAYAGRGSTNGEPFVRLAGDNAAITGVIIAYPEWSQTNVPPVPYPPCILSRDTDNVSVQECCLLNPYEGINFVRAHRHLVRNVTGYPIKRGIFVDECYDIGHIENIHFWPFGVAYDPNNEYCKWINTQGTAFELARTDWHYIHNTFCFGYGVGYKFSKSAQGSANGNFLGLGADSCERAVVVEQAQAPGLLISNGEFVGRWSSRDAVCLEIGPEAEGRVSLVNCSFWGPIDRCVWMRSAVGQFTASACNFVDWDVRDAGSAAIQLDAGKAIVQGCTFARDKTHVVVGSNVVSAILTANQGGAGFKAINYAGKRVQISLNEEDPVHWSDAARGHYRLVIGAPGDARYLSGWQAPEVIGRPMRWSKKSSRLLLPMVRNTPCTLTLELAVPEQALSPTSGLYVDGKLVAPLTSSPSLVAKLPPSPREIVKVEVRCEGWVPQKVIAGSQDPRELGIQLFAVEVRAEGASDDLFDANNGTSSKE